MKTSELIGRALNWAVAKADGAAGTGKIYMHGNVPMMEADLSKYSYQPAPESAFDMPIPAYSTAWQQGGPIIEREKIAVDPDADDGMWAASTRDAPCYWVGPTPLIAVMRCFVASKLGDEVEIPEELQ